MMSPTPQMTPDVMTCYFPSEGKRAKTPTICLLRVVHNSGAQGQSEKQRCGIAHTRLDIVQQ